MTNQKNIPHHVAIIPDGNRRWANQKGLPTLIGHRNGFEALVKVARKSRELDIKVMTIWAFSTENWSRSKNEVSYLMALYNEMIGRYLDEAIKDEIRIIHLGRKDRISTGLRDKIFQAEEKTKDFDKHYLCIALDYGGRDEIMRAVKDGTIKNEDDLSRALDTSMLPYPNPDLIIRTGGEKRLSGFLLWQCQYSELAFVDEYLPDFTPEKFTKCISEYSERNRRFGK
jgi:undecaprenyl diphosphate synthase